MDLGFVTKKVMRIGKFIHYGKFIFICIKCKSLKIFIFSIFFYLFVYAVPQT